jgi:hypothetical protein
MANDGKQIKTGKATIVLLMILTVLVAYIGLMGCTLSSEGWTEEQIVEANKKLMEKELGIEEGAAQYNAELLAKLGVGRIVEITAGPKDDLSVREITMKNEEGKVYWAPISDEIETMHRIKEDGPRGKLLHIITP